MAYEIIEVSPTKRSVQVSVEPGIVRKKRQDIFNVIKTQARLPGFRPGKIPNNIIEKRFSGAINEQLTEDLVRENVNQFFKESDLRVIGNPSLSDVDLKLDNSFSFKIEIDIIPEFELGDYKNVAVEEEKVEVTTEEVEEQLAELQKRNAEYHSITGERPVETGDYTIIDFKGSVDLPEPQKSNLEKKMFGEAYSLHIGSESFIPGFEEGLIGANKNETRELELVFPEDHPQSALAGQKVTFKVTLKDIKEEKLLPIDDEFAKDFGDFENLAALQQKITEDIKSYKEALASNKSKRLLKEKLVDLNSEFVIPEILVEEQINRLIQQMKMYAKGQDETSPEEKEAEREKYKPLAEREVRSMLILSKIAEMENLNASETDLNLRVAEIARNMGKEPQEVLPTLKDKGYLDTLSAEIREEKALNFVYEHAEISEVKVDNPAEPEGDK